MSAPALSPGFHAIGEELVHAYLVERVQDRSLSLSSANNTRYALLDFVETLGRVRGPIGPRHVQDWLDGLRLSPGVTKTRISRARVFCRWLVAHGHLEADPTIGVTLGGRLVGVDSARDYSPREGSVSRLALAYVAERAARGELARVTATGIRYTLLAFADAIGDPPLRDLDRAAVQAWMAGTNYAPATLRTRLAALRTFCEWAVEEGHLGKDPTLRLKKPREPRRLPRGLSAAEVGQLLDALPDVRSQLVALLMLQEGLRRKEVAGVQLGDIDFAERTMMVTGKGGHERILPISEETWATLARYLADLPASAGPLLRSLRDGRTPVGPATIGRIMSEGMRGAGIKTRAYDGKSAHACRHTAATDMLRAGAHLRDVQAALGHATIVSTQRYLPTVVAGLKEAMGGRSYRGAGGPLHEADDGR